jgi:hypothetical protein
VEAEPISRKASGQAQAFTLAEIMLVVGLIGLLAAPNGWALEVGAADGAFVDFTTAGQSTEQGTISTADLLGNPSSIGFGKSNQVMIFAATKFARSAASIDWGPH